MSDSTPVRVLVADDDPEVRRTVKALLELSGHHVVGTVDNGVDAIEQTKRLRPDVVLMDIHMPRKDGIEAVREICLVCPTPVVVMTAYGDREHLRRATDAGAGAFLAKPAHAEELDRAIAVATARFADQQALRQANQELRSQILLYERQVARNRRILDAVMDGYCFTDRDGRIIEASDAYCTLLGLQRQELLGTPLVGLDDELAASIRARADLDERAGCARVEATHLRRDGRAVYVDVGISYVPAEERFFVVVRDVSARTRSEELLRIQRDLAKDLAALNDLGMGLRRVLDACLATEGVDCGGVYLVDPDSGGVQLACHSGLCEEFVALVREFDGNSRQARLVREGRACYLNGASLERDSPLCPGEGLLSVAILPILSDGVPIAALNLGSRVLDGMEPWIRVSLESLAAQVGTAIGRMRAEQALRESEASAHRLLEETTAAQQRLADIIEFLPDATIVVDNDKKVIAWNRAIEEITGTRKEEVLGKGSRDYSRAFWDGTQPILLDLIGVDEAQIEARYENVRRVGNTVSGEAFVPFVYEGKGGDVWVTASPLFDSSGNKIGGIESIRDITESKRVLRALKLAEEKYRGIVENAFEGIFQVTAEGRLATANPALARILGYETAEEAIESCTDFGERLCSSVVVRQQLFDERASVSTVVRFDGELSRADGSRIWAHISVRGIRGRKGELELLEGFVEDITARRVAEEALRGEKALSDAIIDNIPGTFFVIDERAQLIRWNRAFETFGGWDSEELQGLDALSTIVDTDRPRAAAAMARARAEGWASEELRSLRKDGTDAPRLFTATRARVGESTLVVGIGLDISDRKRAEEALRRSEERFAKAFRSNPAAVAVSTLRDGRLLDVNESLARLIGYDREELLGRTVTELELWESPAERDRMTASVLSEHGVRDWESILRAKDGRRLITRYSAELVDLGEEPCLLSLLVDITAQRSSEEMQARLQGELAAAADQWRATFDAVKSALIVVDREGVVRRCNNAARILSGREWDGLIGQSISSLRPGEPWRTAVDLLRRTAETGSAHEAQATSSETGRTWSVEVGLFGERRDSLIVGLHEITAVLELQKTLRQQETMAAMGSLVGSVAHEVRNPLFAISGLLDALEARFTFEAEVEPFLTALRTETDRMSGVMRSLLEYGRPVSDERQRVAIDLVLREAVQLCQRDALAKGVALDIRTEDGLPEVAIDHSRVLEVFRNLVENGIQHSPGGGSVTLEARPRKSRPGWMEVCVTDSGLGFPEGDRQKVFEPFFSRRPGGTGLGLSIVHRVVSAHGGRVRADTGPEGGGVVTVEIPL